MSSFCGPEIEFVPCPMCGTREARTRWAAHDHRSGSRQSFTWVRCLGCGLTYLNPRPTTGALTQHYVHSMYGRHRDRKRGPGWRVRARVKALALRSGRAYPGEVSLPWYGLGRVFARWVEHVPRWVPGGRLLDMGIGAGNYLRSMSDLGWSVVGLDLDLKLLMATRGSHDVDVAAGRAEAMPLCPDAFDVVVMRHVIEHLPAPLDALQDAHAVLKAGGLLRIETPNIASLQAGFFRSKWFHLDAPRHLVLFSPDTLVTALEKAGFRVLQVRTLTSTVGLLGSLQIAFGNVSWQTSGVGLRQSAILRGLAWPVEQAGVVLRAGACIGVWARCEA